MLRALIDICGPDFARSARSVDAVAGRRASFVAVPATVQSVADTLRLAAARGLAVLPRGSGSKIDWGTPPLGVDLLLDTGRLSGMWDHRPDDLVADVGTGTPVSALQAALALRGQRLAVDPPSRGATVGGMLAVNECGPLRHRFGSPAEHVAEISYVSPDGEAGTSDGEDGRPGIAEIDGVITSAKLRLQPLPAARRWVIVPVSTPLQVHNLVEETLAHGLDPSAIEVDLPPTAAASLPTPPPTGAAPGRTTAQPPGSLAVLLEGSADDVNRRATALTSTFGATATSADTAPAWWGRYPFTRADVALRISVAIADLHAAVYALSDTAGGPVAIRGSAGDGTVHAVLPGTLHPDRIESILDTLRHVLLARGGRAVVITAPPETAREIDMAGRRDLF
jgi:glycolate oxidase FAD binding subunit